MNKFAIHLSGPAGSGKTFFSEALGKKIPNLYIVSFDKLKWQLAGYHRDNHSNLIKEIELGFFEVICKKQLPATLDFFCKNEAEYETCKSIAERYGYVFIPIQLTAPKEVLLERFRNRVKRAKETDRKISFTDEALLLANISEKSYVPAGTPVFDTSTTSADQIVSEILQLIEKAGKRIE
jgi:shikimate kinase